MSQSGGVIAEPGNDVLFGVHNATIIQGDVGNDTLTAGFGDDPDFVPRNDYGIFMDGGAGTDAFTIEYVGTHDPATDV